MAIRRRSVGGWGFDGAVTADDCRPGESTRSVLHICKALESVLNLLVFLSLSVVSGDPF